MKKIYFILALSWIGTATMAQEHHHQTNDLDEYHRHHCPSAGRFADNHRLMNEGIRLEGPLDFGTEV